MARADTAAVLAGATVLITGAARGMGAIYARKAADGGAAGIALWDVDEKLASELAAELTRPGLRIEVFPVDVSQLDAIRAGVAATREKLGPVDILINNAGIVRGVPFWQHDVERDIELTMRINTLGPMWLTREVLPDMMSSPARPKRILNIASAAGTLPNPNMSVYAASKWAMIGWSESIRLELSRMGYPHVKVTTFCPSYVSTGMFEGARGPLLTPIMTPDQAASAAWKGMLRGTPMVLRPWTVKLAMALRGLLPTRWWDGAAAKVFHVYSSMDAFVGRKES
ncbi:SDR family NAD(P)-dependent oxidoreductase [Salinibacterium sp. ZJ70]|uniref:SDR family NAD(P)-dependent oxidoreductase n=1 Tax=Salinibacterium sp. ZJ70 TaxID=2708084 RepID=UPI001CD519B9|nr:SDR family NAD(P)-dependent oxidoreductase [Salinibacterium sp. ZJ70]